MAFVPDKNAPQFEDLKGMLNQSKQTDNALYRTIHILLERLEFVQSNSADIVNKINDSVNSIISNVTITTDTTATYLTTDDESVPLPNSVQLLAGANIAFDDSHPNKRIISASGGGGTGGGMDLDYLGNFVSGPVYNDGDIVIGADGVLYMCTVDGTVTPPEPWPGTGVAVNGTIDATYWVVSPHSQLVNERAMNGLGTGYVRSTVGEPSVVPTIPLTDTTGTLPDNRLTANVALVNRNNNFVAQTLGSGTTISGPNSILNFNFPGAGVDQKNWRILSYGGGNPNLYVEGMTDAGGIKAQFAFGGDNNLYGQGGGLSNLNASYLATGIANPARLGNGVANSTVFLRGDSTWAPVDAFPSGLIVMSLAPCPVGWTRIAWDGYFLRGGTPATLGTAGGAASHAHTLGNLQIPSHDHGGQISGTVDADGNHSHAFSGSGSGSTGTAVGQVSGADAGGSFTAPYAAHTHDFSVTVSGQTGDGGFHAHNFRTGIPSQGAIGVVGGMDAASNLPPYVDIYYCQKN